MSVRCPFTNLVASAIKSSLYPRSLGMTLVTLVLRIILGVKKKGSFSEQLSVWGTLGATLEILGERKKNT